MEYWKGFLGENRGRMPMKKFAILESLMIMLDYEHNDLYVHIDKRAKFFHRLILRRFAKEAV